MMIPDVLSMLAGAMMGISLLGFILAFVVVGIVPGVALIVGIWNVGQRINTRTVTEDRCRLIPIT